ncbi:MAG: hypothetical protein LAP87_31015 [Acidobacteriia bacterium]|nr:hypothetical protein [Terriglobia bacterium]
MQLTVTVRPPIPVHGRISVEAGSEVKRRLLEATPSRRSQLQIRPLPANFYVSQVRYNGRVSEEIFLSEPDGPQQELEVVCTAGAGSI